jgi:LPS O-antigen subunit length determinant protein (WzzB/FepE family)
MNNQNNQQIDLLALLSKLLKNKVSILKVTFAFAIFGLCIALMLPKQYSAGSTFVPMMSSDQKSNGLSGLASLAGINIDGGMGGNDISPTLYPEIIASVPFKQAMSQVKIPFEGKQITFKEYALNKKYDALSLIKKYTIGLPGILIGLFKSEDKILLKDSLFSKQVLFISKDDYALYKNFDNFISINVDLKEGFIELNINFDDPVRTAILAQNAQELLQKKVIELKVKQAKEVLQYTQEQYLIKKGLLYAAQDKVNSFKDNAIFYNTTSYQTQLSRLEAEYTTANMIFLEVAKQVEQAKLQVSKDTPIFSILKPVVVPNEKSGPKRFLIIAIWAFLGLVFSAGKTLFQDQIQKFILKVRS